MSRPSAEEMKRVADWLAECTVCGKEHERRTEKRYDMREGTYDAVTYASTGPHAHEYNPRGGSKGRAVRELREAAKYG